MPRKTLYEYEANGRLKNITGAGASTVILDPESASSGSTADGDPIVSDAYVSVQEGNDPPLKLLIENGRLVREILLPEGGTIRTEYNYDRLPIRVATPDGNELLMEYDDEGRLRERRDAKRNFRERFEYSENGLTRFSDAEGRLFQYEYDDAGNLLREFVAVSAEGSPDAGETPLLLEEFEFLDNGQVSRKISDGRDYRFEYDEQGNLKSAANGSEETIHWTNDLAGNLLRREQNGSLREFDYDALNRPLRVREGELSVDYAYDEFGYPERIQFPHSAINQRHDAQGRLIEQSDSRGAWTYTYTERNQIETIHKPNGVTIAYEYDSRGNIVRITAPGETIEQEFDAADRLIRSRNGATILEREYDATGELKSESVEIDGRKIPVEYAYDRSGKLTGVASTGQSVAYEWSATGQLASISANAGAFRLDTSRGIPFHPEVLENQNVRFEQKHNGNGRFVSSSVTGTNADLEIELEYNSFGRCTGRHDSDGPAWNYEYDVQDQLTGAQKTSGSGPDYELSIRYDASGNRVEENGAPKTYDEFRELLESDAEFNYAYDVLGNLIQKTSLGDGSVAAYTYDDFDRLIKFELRAADDTLVRSGSYAYDPQGRRIRKTVQEAAGTPATTYCIYDGPNLFLELDAAFEVRRSYVNLRTIDSLLGFVEGDRAFYFLRGKFNTVEAVYDDTGELRARYIYGPFGDLLGEAANINNDILFANREFDRESGLYFNRARHYDARAGRFLQPDPAQGSFRDPRTLVYSYAYAANNPLRYYDPTGFSFWDDLWKGITNVAGAIWDVIKYIGKTIWNLTKLVVGVLLNPWVLIDLTWGGFGTALGMIIGAGAILLGGEAEIVWGKGVKVVYPDWIRDLLPEKNRRSAFSLGPVVIGSSSFNNWDHEFGHTWQNRILGPLYIPVIAIPSFISAATNTPAEHRNQWYERWADDLADWENSGGVQAWGGA